MNNSKEACNECKKVRNIVKFGLCDDCYHNMYKGMKLLLNPHIAYLEKRKER